MRRNGQILIMICRGDDPTSMISSMDMNQILDSTLIGPGYKLIFGLGPFQEIDVYRNYTIVVGVCVSVRTVKSS